MTKIPYNFTHMWNIKQKATNKQDNQKLNSHRQQYGACQRQKGLGG